MVERIMDPKNIRADHLERYNFAVKRLKDLKPENILDIGCGIGYGSLIMHNLLCASIDCIDKSVEAHDVFEEAFSRDVGKVNYIVTDITKLEPRTLRPAYDAVVSFEFIEHIPPELSQDVFDLAADKSDIFIVSSPNECVRPHQLPPINEFHYKHYTPVEFETMGKQAGFTDVEFFCQTSGKHYTLRTGLEQGKFMIGVFTKAKVLGGGMGTLDLQVRGHI